MPSTSPDAMTVEEVTIGLIVTAAMMPPVNPDPADQFTDTVNTWRKLYPTVEAVALEHGVAMTEPVGFLPALRIVNEAAPYLQAKAGVLS